jgi:hypothetical protein
VSTQPPAAPGEPPLPPPGTLRCPRCSAPVGPDQDWCLECGAPARTRLAQTPNWQLPTVAIGAIILIAGALLAFAFVKLTQDDGPAPAATVPVATTPAPVAPVPVVPPPVTTTPTTPGQATTATTATTTTPTTSTTTPATTTPASTTQTTTSTATAPTTSTPATTTQTKSTPAGTKTAP